MNDVIKLDVSGTVLEGARAMTGNGKDSLIVTRDGKPAGIITEHDIVEKVTAKGIAPAEVTCEEIMSSPIISAGPATSVIEASSIMVKSKIRRLAVLQGDDIAGIVTDRDILTISPILNTILESLIEMNEETKASGNGETGRGICQRCGSYVDVLKETNGLMLCEDQTRPEKRKTFSGI
jgi:signal-transduction protein with cAMP-binding, CBS, and nucleotidyltransferase domain